MLFRSAARAAASASTPSIQGGNIFDHLDAKNVQFQFSVDHLRRMLELLNAMHNSITSSENNQNIIPLTNLISSLCAGWFFNVHSTLKKRFALILNGKLIKLTSIKPILSTQLVEYKYDFLSPADSGEDFDFEKYKKKFYNFNHQLKSLESLISIIHNALQFYEVKLKQIIMERSSNRRPDASGVASVIDHESLVEFTHVQETQFSLDLAVLVEDKLKDTTDESFRNLQLQVLKKTQDVVKQFHDGTLCGFSKTMAALYNKETTVSQLPYWQFTFHRMYAFLLRCTQHSTFVAEIMHQLYYPSKAFFNDNRTKLFSKNLIEYEHMLALLEDTLDVVFLENMVKDFCENNVVIFFQTNTITSLYSRYIFEVEKCIKYRHAVLGLWIEHWEYLEKNIGDNLKEYTDFESSAQLLQLVEERRVNDRITCKKPLLENNVDIKAPSQPAEFKAAILRKPYKASNSTTKSVVRSGSTKKHSASSSTTSSRNRSNLASPQANSNPGSPRPGPVQAPFARAGRSRSSSLQHVKHTANKEAYNMKLAAAAAGLSTGMSGNDAAQKSHSLQLASLETQAEIQKQYSSQPKFSHQPLKPQPTSVLMKKSASENNRGSRQEISSTLQNELIPKLANVHLKEDTLRSSGKPMRTNSKKQEGKTKYTSSSESRQSDASIVVSDLDLKKTENSENEAYFDSEEYPHEIMVKKVRFTGVPPFNKKEDPPPTRRGWYIKPAVLHYPLIPCQNVGVQQNVSKQAEGLAFKRGHSLIKE
ncbi:hypothetical protein ACO0RG_003584 [Hanseniaspora osmophila]